MEELHITENSIFLFNGHRYVWQGDEITQLGKNNRYHLQSAAIVAGDGYKHGVLHSKNRKVKLIFEHNKPQPFSTEVPQPEDSDDDIPPLPDDSNDDIPPLPKLPFKAFDIDSNLSSGVSVLSDMNIPAGHYLAIGDVKVVINQINLVKKSGLE